MDIQHLTAKPNKSLFYSLVCIKEREGRTVGAYCLEGNSSERLEWNDFLPNWLGNCGQGCCGVYKRFLF